MDLGFNDSASQQKDNLSLLTGTEAIEQLKNRPFASNLENAQVLAKLTRARIEKLGEKMNEEKVQFLIDEGASNSEEYKKEYTSQLKVNKFLTGTLKHLNITIDILIEQYDPVKLKAHLKHLTEKYGDPNDKERRKQK